MRAAAASAASRLLRCFEPAWATAKRIIRKLRQKSFSESRRMVTGPSLVNSRAIMA